MENHYGKIIKQEREAADMTQEELANLLLISPGYLAAVEREEDALSDFRLNMIANTFHISKSRLIQGVSHPQMDAEEAARVLENISKEIEELQEIQALLEQQIYDEKVNNVREAESVRSSLEMNINTLFKEKSLEERYTMAMEMAGYELAWTEPGSMATVTFKIKNSDRTVAFDGWQAVGLYLEDVTLTDEAEAKRFDELIHPQGRIQFVTQNLDGKGRIDDIMEHPDMETALNAYLNAGWVDGKAIGFTMEGQEPSPQAVILAYFEMVDMSHYIRQAPIELLVPEATVNELEQIESMRRVLSDALIKDNAYSKIQNAFKNISMRARWDIIRQNSEWGAWSGHIANSHRPQDYVKVDITGYSTHHEVVYTLDIIHANEVVDSKMLAVDTDGGDLAAAMEKAYTTAQNEFAEFLKEAVEKLGTDLRYPMRVYTPHTYPGIEEHRERLNALGYFPDEGEEKILRGDFAGKEELEKENPYEEEGPEEEPLPEKEIRM